MPVRRAKATLNVLADPYPTRSATSSIARSPLRKSCLANAIRHVSRYSIGATPTIRLKRAKNAERESAASFARSTTVQGLRVSVIRGQGFH